MRTKVPTLPYGNAEDFKPNSHPFEGVVLIMEFPPSEGYPEGTHHLAYVYKLDINGIYVQETNRVADTYTETLVSWEDPRIVGFYNPLVDPRTYE